MFSIVGRKNGEVIYSVKENFERPSSRIAVTVIPLSMAHVAELVKKAKSMSGYMKVNDVNPSMQVGSVVQFDSVDNATVAFNALRAHTLTGGATKHIAIVCYVHTPLPVVPEVSKDSVASSVDTEGAMCDKGSKKPADQS